MLLEKKIYLVLKRKIIASFDHCPKNRLAMIFDFWGPQSYQVMSQGIKKSIEYVHKTIRVYWISLPHHQIPQPCADYCIKANIFIFDYRLQFNKIYITFKILDTFPSSLKLPVLLNKRILVKASKYLSKYCKQLGSVMNFEEKRAPSSLVCPIMIGILLKLPVFKISIGHWGTNFL